MAGRFDQRLSKRQQRLSDKGGVRDNVVRIPSLQHLHLDLKNVTPLTPNQQLAFDAYDKDSNVLLHGCPGTGKTFLALYLAFKEIYDKRSNKNKIVIIRSAQSSKPIGFLKGDEKQKIAVYEAPYRAHCAKLFERDDAYEVLKQRGMIDFQSTSFLRGTEFENAVIIVDEIQNLSYMELKTALTRTGENSRVTMCGDTNQDDLTSKRYNEESGLSDIMRVLQRMQCVEQVNFTVDDIVRSGFVRDFIIAEYELVL